MRGLIDDYVYIAYYDGSRWSNPQTLYRWYSNVSPTLVVYRDELYAMWKGWDNNQIYFSKTSNGVDWSSIQSFSGGHVSKYAISAVTYKDRLYVMCSNGDKLHYAWFDGNQWSNFHEFSNSNILLKYNKWYLTTDLELAGAPSLVVVKDELRLIYSFGPVTQSKALYASTYFYDSNSWSDPNFIDIVRSDENFREHHLIRNISSCINIDGSIHTPFVSGHNFFHTTYQIHQKKLHHVPLNYRAEKIRPVLKKASKTHQFDAIFALTDELINSHLSDMFKSVWAGGNPIKEATLPWKLDTIEDVSPVTPSIKDAYILKSERRRFFCPKIEIINSTSSRNPKSEVLLSIDLFGGEFYPDGINNRSTAIEIKNWKFKIKSNLGVKKLNQDLLEESYPEFRDKLNNMRRSYGDIDILFLDLQSAELFGDVEDINFNNSKISEQDKKKFVQSIRDYVQSLRYHRHGNPHGWIFSGVVANREVNRTLPDKGELYFTDSAFAVHASQNGKAVYWLLMSDNNAMPNIIDTNVAGHYLVDERRQGTFHFAASVVLDAVMTHLHGVYGNVSSFDIQGSTFVVSNIERREFCFGASIKKDVRFSYKDGKVFGEITDIISPYLPNDASNHYVLFPSTNVTVKSRFEYDTDLKENKIFFKGRSINSNIIFTVGSRHHTEEEFNQQHPVDRTRQENRNWSIADLKAKLQSENQMLLSDVNHSFLQIAQPAHTKYDFSLHEINELFGFKVNLNSKQ